MSKSIFVGVFTQISFVDLLSKLYPMANVADNAVRLEWPGKFLVLN